MAERYTDILDAATRRLKPETAEVVRWMERVPEAIRKEMRDAVEDALADAAARNTHAAKNLKQRGGAAPAARLISLFPKKGVMARAKMSTEGTQAANHEAESKPTRITLPAQGR